MTKKNILTSLIKKFNAETLKLSWVYIITITLIAALIVQFYRGSVGKTTPVTHDDVQLEQRIDELVNKVDTQNKQIEKLQQEIEQLKAK